MGDADAILEALKVSLGNIENEQQAALMIERARVMVLCYCNIPLNAKMPEGLFEAWEIAAEQLVSGDMGVASAISEGDVSIKFENSGKCFDWKLIADRFKRMSF